MLAENIRKYRKKSGLTQRGLAEQLFLTPQTVSKWEKGLSEPNLKDLCKLSSIFSISTDTLLGNHLKNDNQSVMIAIDGGGTKTVFVLFSQTGSILDHVVLSGCSPSVYGLDGAISVLKSGIDTLLADKAIDPTGIYIGTAGGMSGSNGQKITKQLKALYPYTKIKVTSDVENVVGSVPGINSCVSVICGTGSIIYVKDAEGFHRLGGWGYHLDEYGSGFTLGRDALRAALADNEGTGKKTAITELVESRLGSAVWNKIDTIYSEGVDFIASFSKAVFKAYAMGDAVATEILKKNIAYISDMINFSVHKYSIERNVILAGGVISNNRTDFLTLLNEKLDTNMNIIVPDMPPIFGAAMNCCSLFSQPDTDFEDKFSKDLSKIK